MGRFTLGFRCLFGVLFQGRLPEDVVEGLAPTPAPAPATPAVTPASSPEGIEAVQLLALLQRDGRLVDFLMEDISAYADDQVGAAVREVHDRCRESLIRYVRLGPVMAGTEGTIITVPESQRRSPAVKFVGNVPAQPPSAGILRHRGWRAEGVKLPAPLSGGLDLIAPAEVEVE